MFKDFLNKLKLNKSSKSDFIQYSEENESDVINNDSVEVNDTKKDSNGFFGIDNIGGNFKSYDELTDINEQMLYEEELKKPIEKKKYSVGFIIATSIMLFIIVILMLFLRGCFSDPGQLKSADIDYDSIIYLGEESNVTAKAVGRGNLKSTKFLFDTSSTIVAELETKVPLTGKKVTNKILPLKTGTFTLLVNASTTDDVLPTIEKDITICSRLSASTLGASEVFVDLGKTTSLEFDLGEDVCYKNIKYTLEKPDIAAIDEKNIISGLVEGRTDLTISDNDKSVTIKIYVLDGKNKVTGVSLNKETTRIYVGSTEQLQATITPKNATNTNLGWVSDNENIVTVTPTGLIKGISKGSTVITVTTKDGEFVDTIKVDVVEKTTPVPAPPKDNIVPKVTITKVTGATGGNNKVTIAATLEDAGTLVGYQINKSSKIPTSGWTSVSGISKSVSFDVTSDGIYYIYAKDKTGNVGSAKSTISYGTWSGYTTTSCNTANTNTCKSISGYNMKTRTSSACNYYCDTANYSSRNYVCTKSAAVYSGVLCYLNASGNYVNCTNKTGLSGCIAYTAAQCKRNFGVDTSCYKSCTQTGTTCTAGYYNYTCPSGYSWTGNTCQGSCYNHDTCYGEWGSGSLVATCTAGNTTSCTATTLYQTRTLS